MANSQFGEEDRYLGIELGLKPGPILSEVQCALIGKNTREHMLIARFQGPLDDLGNGECEGSELTKSIQQLNLILSYRALAIPFHP